MVAGVYVDGCEAWGSESKKGKVQRVIGGADNPRAGLGTSLTGRRQVILILGNPNCPRWKARRHLPMGLENFKTWAQT